MKRATRTKRSSTFSTNILSPFREISPLKRVLPWLLQPTESSIRIKYNFSLAEKKASKLVSHARWKDSIFEIYIYIYGFYKRWLIHWPREFHWFRVHGNGSRHWVRIGSSRALLSAPLLSTLLPPVFLPSPSFSPFLFPFVPHFAPPPSFPRPTYSLPPLSFLPLSLSLHFFSLRPSRFQECLRRSQMSLMRSGIDASPFFWSARFGFRSGERRERGEKKERKKSARHGIFNSSLEGWWHCGTASIHGEGKRKGEGETEANVVGRRRKEWKNEASNEDGWGGGRLVVTLKRVVRLVFPCASSAD